MGDGDSIFLADDRGALERVPYRPYEAEQLLQKLLDEHPELLVGEQINPDHPPRWIVVRREAGIPDSEGAGSRWAVDHLLLDQYARPTFVEVKRSSDTRIRREVVGQMLDYAANAQAYWPRDRIKALAAENFGSVEELDTAVQEFLGDDLSATESADIDAYWSEVEENLQSGQVRLLFVADSIPTELRRIIEFLNEHMPRVEVLGVEIRQYEGSRVRALVPRVVGQTEYARQQKRSSGGSSGPTTLTAFLDSCPESAKRFFEGLFREVVNRGFTVAWGRKGFSVRKTMGGGNLGSFFYGYPPGVNSSEVPLFQAYLRYFENQALREQMRAAFSAAVPFVPKGEHTLEIGLDATGVKAATDGLISLLEAVEAALQGAKLPDHEP